MPKSSPPYLPVKYEIADAVAVQALRRGEADPDQQIRAMEFILDVICDRTGMSYRPGADGDRDTAFAEGRRFCGNQIVKMGNLPVAKLMKERNK